jgi:hypothetical protein
MRYQTLDNKIKCLTQQQTHTHLLKKNFYPRVVNMTDISFLEPEVALLQKSPKYNLHDKPKDWIQTLVLEAETAISRLPTTEWEVYRKMTAERINTLQNNNKHPPPHTQQNYQEYKN